MKYGELGNKKLYQRYEVKTSEGLVMTSRFDGLLAQERSFRAMGVANVCPRCGKPCAVFLGEQGGEHWCLACQVLADPEGLK